MKLIHIIRGVHRNELTAFKIAKQVYEELLNQGYGATLETIPYDKTMWQVFKEANRDSSFKGAKLNDLLSKKIGYSLETELLKLRSNNFRRVYSFHNYAINLRSGRNKFLEGIPEDILGNDAFGLIEFIQNFQDMEMNGEICHIADSKVPGIIIEIPAVYETETKIQIQGLDQRLNEYLHYVDIKRTKDTGLFGTSIVQEIVQGIIRFNF